jgi:L-seryl-tRNA(Ser) seleniumtransferase
LIDATGAHVTEIGSNSDCLHDDYAKATAMHPHSLIFQATPIASQNDAYALSDHARSTGSLVCTLALDASLVDLDWTDCKTPALTRRWDSGPDLIIAPTQYLIGGPDAVVILGKKNAIDRIRPWADQLGAQADRVTQALLHCALSESLQPESWAKTYLGAMLNTSLANTENRAQRLAIQLQGLWPIQRTEVVTESTRIGNGTWQALRKPTAVLRIYPQSISAAKLNETLAQNQPAIWTQVYSDRIELVLRSVDPADDAQIVQAISKLQPVT